MPVRDLLEDYDFRRSPPEEQRAFLTEHVPDFAAMPAPEQDEFLAANVKPVGVTEFVGRNLAAGWAGASAGVNRTETNLFKMLDTAADAVSKATGMPKGGAFGELAGYLQARQPANVAAAEKADPGIAARAIQTVGGAPMGLAEAVPAVMAGGPVAGLAGLGALGAAHEGPAAMAKGAAKGGAIGALFPAAAARFGPLGQALTVGAGTTAIEAKSGTPLPEAAMAGLATGALAGGGATLARRATPELPTAAPPVRAPKPRLKLNTDGSISDLRSGTVVAPAPDTVPPAVRKALDSNTTALDIGPPPADGLTHLRFAREVDGRVVSAADELLTAGEVKRDSNRMISDQISELLATERIDAARFNDVLRKYELTPEEFAGAWRVDVRRSAQQLANLSILEQRVRRMTEGLVGDEEMAALGGSSLTGAGWWRQADNVRRGLLVTQLATAMRNMITQVGRVGLDSMQQTLDAGLLKLFPDKIQQARPTNALGALSRLLTARSTKAEVNDLLSRFPMEQDALFNRYSSDVTRAGAGSKAMRGVQRTVDILNTANRAQEHWIRRAVFGARLDQVLARRGTSLREALETGKAGEISRDELGDAISGALEATFAKNYSPRTAGGAFIEAVNRIPGATLPIPFPRFLVNSIEFLYDFSPAPMLKAMVSPKEWRKIAAGDTSTISRATIGTGLFLAAWQARNSEYAGERWYEIEVGGKTYDARPFAPFSSYLFVADLIKRSNEGTLNRLTFKDIASGVLSANVRAGVGSFAVDKIAESLAGVREEDGWKRMLASLTGETVGGLATPFQQVKDIVAQFDQSQRVVRESEANGLAELMIGPTASRIPYAEQLLEERAGMKFPPVEVPTQAGPPMRQAPLLRQLTGLTVVSPKNPAQKELDRLGYIRSEIMPASGVPEYDRERMKAMGPLVEKMLSPLVSSPAYQNLSDPMKGEMLREWLGELRSMSDDIAASRDPLAAVEARMKKMPRRKRRALESLQGGAP